MKTILETSITIQAPIANIWRMFADPTLTRQMGGEYVTDWNVGSSFTFKNLDGVEITTGTLLRCEPEKLLQHTVLNSIRLIDSTITYEFSEQNGVTILKGREEFSEPISNDEYADSLEGWNAALNMVKDIAIKQ